MQVRGERQCDGDILYSTPAGPEGLLGTASVGGGHKGRPLPTATESKPLQGSEPSRRRLPTPVRLMPLLLLVTCLNFDRLALFR